MYKPPIVTQGTISGRGVINISPDNKRVRIMLTRSEGVGDERREVTKKYILLKSNCPKNLKEGEFVVRLSGKPGRDREMLSFYPLDGVFNVTFSKIPSPEDEPPRPKQNTGQHGTWETFIVLLKVVDGEFEGVQIPVFANYNFTMYEDENGNEVTAYSKSFSRSPKTVYTHELLDALGVWEDGAIEYEDNLLPTFQSIANSKKKKFRVAISGGQVTEFRSPVETASAWDENEGDGEDDSESDEPPFDLDDEDEGFDFDNAPY